MALVVRNGLQAAQPGGWGGWKPLVQRGRDRERKGIVSVLRRNGGGRSSLGRETSPVAQLGLEADASRARRLRKASKGWTWWNLPSGASLKLWHWAQRQEVLSTAWVARIPPFPWSPWLTEGCALPQLTLSRQTPSPLREHLSRPPFLTQRGETRGTHVYSLRTVRNLNKVLLPDLSPITPLGSFQPCMDKGIFELDVPFSGNLLFLSLQQHPSTLRRGLCFGSERGGVLQGAQSCQRAFSVCWQWGTDKPPRDKRCLLPGQPYSHRADTKLLSLVWRRDALKINGSLP